ncbi:ATP-binding protein [Nocardiopsis sp. NPDC050513]|uniref:ATP-binding protein n=1 Tax=Nocardiopsis sp. NPDC050513 TaxID=3364338 RepID=UPI0037AD6184
MGEQREALPKRIPSVIPGVRMASFGSLPGQVATSRQWCWHGSGLSFDRAYPLLTVASELHTNALRHTASGGRFGRVRLRMERHGALIQVAVTDDGMCGGAAPTVPCLGGGYGLRLVEELSQAWGWFGRPGGPLTVWAVVDPRADEAHVSGAAETPGDPGEISGPVGPVVPPPRAAA